MLLLFVISPKKGNFSIPLDAPTDGDDDALPLTADITGMTHAASGCGLSSAEEGLFIYSIRDIKWKITSNMNNYSYLVRESESNWNRLSFR